MSLQTAIQALNPRNYWPLDTASGGYYTDLGSTPNAMQVIGDSAGVGATGPELGSHAYRVFSGGNLSTSGMGITAWTDFTIMFMMTAAAAGSVSGTTIFAGFGDINNPSTRGFTLRQLSASAATENISWGSGAQSQQVGFPFPQSFWHLFTWTHTASTNSNSVYVDAGGPTTSVAALTTAPVSGDTIWIKSAQPLVIAHMAYWPSVLTNVQIQTVGNQIQAWPYGEPINVPVAGSTTGVTISPTDTVTQQLLTNQGTFMPQITDIGTKQTTILANTNTMDTNWSNYTSVTLPSLNTLLASIDSGLNVTIFNPLSNITKRIGEFFNQHSHDKFGVFSFTGGTTCAKITADLSGTGYFGMALVVETIPPAWTFTTPADNWGPRDLAVVTIKIGSIQMARYGIHSTSWEIITMPGALDLSAGGVGLNLMPPGYVVTVDWAPGACGQLLLYYTP